MDLEIPKSATGSNPKEGETTEMTIADSAPGAKIKDRINDNAEALFNTALSLALGGDKLMLKIFLPYILPSIGDKGKKLSLPSGGVSLESMPDLAASLLAQVSDGSMSTKRAKEVAEVMGVYLQSQEMFDTERRLDRMEVLTKEVEEMRKAGETVNLAERRCNQVEIFR